MKRADDALYQAKQEGRNCVRVEQPEGAASGGETPDCTEDSLPGSGEKACVENAPVH